MTKTMDLLSAKEQKVHISLMNKVGNIMSHELFRVVAQKFVLTPIETVILRKKEAKI